MLRFITFICLATILLSLTACSLGKVTTPQPTGPTAIPIPLTKINPLLVQEGDLPGGLVPGTISVTPADLFDKPLPQAKQTIDQRFTRDGSVGGGVTVYLYDSIEISTKIYSDGAKGLQQRILGNISVPQAVPGMGDKAEVALVSDRGNGRGDYEMAFLRCRAFIYVQMINVEKIADIVTYAHNLDKRINSLVCDQQVQ